VACFDKYQDVAEIRDARMPAFGRGFAANCSCRVRRYAVVRFDSATGNIQVSHFAPPLLRGGIPVCAYPPLVTKRVERPKHRVCVE
jgi:hypothetical protein